MSRAKALLVLLNNLQILYNDLNGLVVAYEKSRQWETIASSRWKSQNDPAGLISDQQHLWVCDETANVVLKYNSNGEIVKRSAALKVPFGIDMEEKEGRLYVADKTHITILNFNLEICTSWMIPIQIPLYSDRRRLKVNNNVLYLTIQNSHHVYLCKKTDGQLLNTFGTSGSKDGQFESPSGITVNNQYLYVCDKNNHRVQLLTKDEGVYCTKWGIGKEGTTQGEFSCPNSIYYSFEEKIVYIGDNYSVQLFEKKEGICIQRLGDTEQGKNMNQFYVVASICIMNEQLFISDEFNQRIQIFKRALN